MDAWVRKAITALGAALLPGRLSIGGPTGLDTSAAQAGSSLAQLTYAAPAISLHQACDVADAYVQVKVTPSRECDGGRSIMLTNLSDTRIYCSVDPHIGGTAVPPNGRPVGGFAGGLWDCNSSGQVQTQCIFAPHGEEMSCLASNRHRTHSVSTDQRRGGSGRGRFEAGPEPTQSISGRSATPAGMRRCKPGEHPDETVYTPKFGRADWCRL